MKSHLLFLPILLLLISFELDAQRFRHGPEQHPFLENTSIKFALGTAVAGPSYYDVITFETEFTKNWNRLFGSSVSLNFGHKMPNHIAGEFTFAAADASFFYTPFGNDRTHVFKIGIGASYAYTTSNYLGFAPQATASSDPEIFIENNTSLGPLVQTEYLYNLNQRITIGAEASLKMYSNSPWIAGAALKFGINLLP